MYTNANGQIGSVITLRKDLIAILLTPTLVLPSLAALVIAVFLNDLKGAQLSNTVQYIVPKLIKMKVCPCLDSLYTDGDSGKSIPKIMYWIVVIITIRINTSATSRPVLPLSDIGKLIVPSSLRGRHEVKKYLEL